jgi:hypothetical protein
MDVEKMSNLKNNILYLSHGYYNWYDVLGVSVAQVTNMDILVIS